MTAIQIADLDTADPAIATDIHAVMMAAYGVEAGLLGVSDFPPLKRTKKEIADAASAFIGAYVDNGFAAVAEIERDRTGTITIAALVVLPKFFRQGLGAALVRNIIDAHEGARLVVCTGARNAPAVSLYKKLDFDISRSWISDDGISMVALVREP